MTHPRRLFEPDENEILTSVEEEREKYEFVEGILNRNGGKDLTRNPHVLDVGCGGGHLLKYLKQRGIEAVGVDITYRPELDGLNVVIADAHQLPFDDGFFDIAWSSGLYDPTLYKQDEPRLMREIFRVVRRGGVYVIDDPDQPNLHIPGTAILLDKLPMGPDVRVSILGKVE
jgi:SAM-dependent methyltransferase